MATTAYFPSSRRHEQATRTLFWFGYVYPNVMIYQMKAERLEGQGQGKEKSSGRRGARRKETARLR